MVDAALQGMSLSNPLGEGPRELAPGLLWTSPHVTFPRADVPLHPFTALNQGQAGSWESSQLILKSPSVFEGLRHSLSEDVTFELTLE